MGLAVCNEDLVERVCADLKPAKDRDQIWVRQIHLC